VSRRRDHDHDVPRDRPFGGPPPHDAANDASEVGGSLPPYSSLGLGPAPAPGFERVWEPPVDDLPETDNLPDKPPSRVSRGARILIPIAVGLLLVAGAVGLVWFDVIGGSNAPTPTPDVMAGLDNPTHSAADTPRSTLARGTPTARAQQLSAFGTPTTGGVPTNAPPVSASPMPGATATREPPLLLAVGVGDVGELHADEFGKQLRDALATQLPGRQIDIVGENRIGEAAFALGGSDPGATFDGRLIAAAPLALVTSPRLPLTGVGRDQAERLLHGAVTDWREVGAAPQIAVEPLALKGYVAEGASPVETFRTYESLVAGLADHPGGVALVPIDLVDFRVNVLAVDGIDPVRGSGDLAGYPFGARLFVGVRHDLAGVLSPALDGALASLGLPQTMPSTTTIGFGGDVVPGRNPHQRFGAPDDPTHSFTEIGSLLAGYDVSVVNVEGALSAASAGAGTATPFAAGPAFTAGLKLAGVDAVTLANEHSRDLGAAGLTDTIATLQSAGIAPFGAGANLDAARAALILDVNGIKIALIGANGVRGDDDAATTDSPGVNALDIDRLRADIGAASKDADVVIAYLHLGATGRPNPPESAIEAARAAIDAGATLVVASHPGVAGGMEIYKGKPIVYSLGNLVADQMQSVETRQGVILEVTLRGDTIVQLRFHGVEIEDFNQPRLMTDAEEAALLDRIWQLSDQLHGER
jgi:poly-gamma-glutamate capsule biosynthesis protein CapA/YwtB (metallophosphatase superfamily)